MSFQAMAWAMRQELPCTEKFVLVCLADVASAEDFTCFPSQGHLAKQAGLTRTTVNKVLGNLQKSGLIEVVHRKHSNGGDRSCLYRLKVVVPQPKGGPTSLTPPGKRRLQTGVNDVNTLNLSLNQSQGKNENGLGKKEPDRERIAKGFERLAASISIPEPMKRRIA